MRLWTDFRELEGWGKPDWGQNGSVSDRVHSSQVSKTVPPITKERVLPVVLGDCALTYVRCFSVARRLPWIALVLVVAAGCTRGFFRKRADKDVENLLAEKSIDPRWAVDGWYVYPDKRARFADFDKRPDRPRKPPTTRRPGSSRSRRRSARPLFGGGGTSGADVSV